jgi:hypothetical protein
MTNSASSASGSSKSRARASWLSAGLFAAFVLALSSGMLICNSFFCYFLIGFVPLPASQVGSLVLSQLFYFLVPVILTFLQWYLFDRLKRSFS